MPVARRSYSPTDDPAETVPPRHELHCTFVDAISSDGSADTRTRKWEAGDDLMCRVPIDTRVTRRMTLPSSDPSNPVSIRCRRSRWKKPRMT